MTPSAVAWVWTSGWRSSTTTCASPLRHQVTGLLRCRPWRVKPSPSRSSGTYGSPGAAAISTNAGSTRDAGGGAGRTSGAVRAVAVTASRSSRKISDRIASRAVTTGSTSRTTSLNTSIDSGPR